MKSGKPMDYRLRLDEEAWRRQQWNLRELSEALDTSYQNVLYWNQGRAVPKLPMLVKIMKVLNCRFEDLLELYPSFFKG
jgi:DNA-binding Xre family transcriptional regulator